MILLKGIDEEVTKLFDFLNTNKKTLKRLEKMAQMVLDKEMNIKL
jgi:hypothetical protein